LKSVSLSNIELYYITPELIGSKTVEIRDDEYHHIIKVMRHTSSDEIYITGGNGKIFKTLIRDIHQNFVECEITQAISYDNKLANVYLCIPKLKSADRFEYALEKSVELGITNFIIFNAVNSISKTERLDRWQKILISAMKQSLRCYLPKIILVKSIQEIVQLEGEKIVLEQNADNSIIDWQPKANQKYYFIFGPEGGLDRREIEQVEKDSIFSMGTNRLRSDTAILTLTSFLNFKLNF
jgi:16S rRNA (uracil1498-N3)-methyltransferase